MNSDTAEPMTWRRGSGISISFHSNPRCTRRSNPAAFARRASQRGAAGSRTHWARNPAMSARISA
jgi:hypothetical protein